MSLANPLLDFNQGISQRQCTWEFELLDQQLANARVIEVDRTQPPTLSVDTSRGIKRTLTNVRFPPDVIREVNVIQDRLRVTMVLEDASRWQQGVFLFSDESRAILTRTQDVRVDVGAVNLVDQLMIVDQETDRSVDVRPGVTITDVFVLLFAIFTPFLTINIVPNPARVTPQQEAISWPAGTSLLRIINELAAMIGYHDLYFDNQGMGQLGPMPNPETVDPSTVLTYPVGGRTYLGSTTRSTNVIDLPNRFIVIGGGASDTAVVGIYDVPASAPHSFQNRGFRVTHVEQQQGVETNAQARNAARALARDWRFPFETVEFSGPPDPRHDHYNVLNFEGDPFLELSWTLPLIEGSEMRHVIRRTYEGEESDPLGLDPETEQI